MLQCNPHDCFNGCLITVFIYYKNSGITNTDLNVVFLLSAYAVLLPLPPAQLFFELTPLK